KSNGLTLVITLPNPVSYQQAFHLHAAKKNKKQKNPKKTKTKPKTTPKKSSTFAPAGAGERPQSSGTPPGTMALPDRKWQPLSLPLWAQGRGDGPRHEGRGWGCESQAHLRLDMRSLPGVGVAVPLGASAACWEGATGRPAESPQGPCGTLGTRP
ncbi:unnamed protein product, partial [Bubo scandiacus]